MAKLLKLRRGSTTQHSSFTGAEGEVTIDTTKDTAVVHDGSNAGGFPLAKENMANVSSASIAGRLADDAINPSKIAGGTLGTDVKVADGNINGNLTIENADVTNTAAIAGTKISPDFGSQNIATTGDVTIDSDSSKLKLGVDGDIEIFHDGNHSNIMDKGTGNLAIHTNGAELQLAYNNNSGTFQHMVKCVTSGQVELYHNGSDKFATNSSGAEVRGNLAVTGTVDGVDVAALKTSKDSLSTTNGTVLGSVVLANGVTATTQSASDNSTKVATTAYTDTAISNLVDSSPGALNTLNELAAAVGDDANFSTTITNSIATKMPLAGGEFTGDVTCENITPDADSSRSLGTNAVRFANIYGDTLYGDGSNLTGIVSFVSGMIILWSGSTGSIPSGWVLCNGSNSTPDLRDRFVVGAGSSYSVNATGGLSTVTLSTSELPSHSHTTNNHSHSFDAGNHTHSFSGSGSSTHSHSYSVFTPGGWGNNTGYTQRMHNRYPTGYNTGDATVSLSVSGNTGNASVSGNTGNSNPTTNNTGSGSAHENKPPYYALCYIMKT